MTTGVGPTRSRQLCQDEVDGVPVFFVESDQTPVAVLSFRAGFFDEPLVRRGWLHLLEHRAMHGRDDPSFHTNASVGLLHTEFQVAGETEDVVAFLRDVTTWLADPDLSELEHERSVLEAESAQRPRGDLPLHLDYRFGAAGVGGANYPELGLHTATEEGLRETAARFFTRDNAALALTFRPPEGLQLHLPPGELVPAPAPTERMRLKLPGHAGGATRDLAATGIITDSKTSLFVRETLTRAATQRLRHELGSSYGTQGTVERINDDELLLCLISDVVEDRAAEGVQLLRVALDEARRDLTDETLQPIRTRAEREMRNVPDGVWQAFNSATAHLRGEPPVHEEEVVEHLRATTAETVRAQVDLFLRSALYTSPSGESSRTTMPFNTGFTPVSSVGKLQTYRPWAVKDDSVLEVSDRSLRIASSHGDRTIELATVVALLRFPDGARTLVPRDGGGLLIEPGLWRGGSDAVATIDTIVPESVVVPMPARDEADVAALPAAGRRLISVVRRFLRGPHAWMITAVVAIALLVVAIQNGRSLLPFVIFTGLSIAAYREARHGPSGP